MGNSLSVGHYLCYSVTTVNSPISGHSDYRTLLYSPEKKDFRSNSHKDFLISGHFQIADTLFILDCPLIFEFIELLYC